ncbi:MlaE family lipid ABC transporter permease subunit [Sphingomonas antarctica]|uniref:ABC transporter permease n=1 Tax=Sphingomonas antarctica TaxID=2040274 RepID=UPI0039EA8637
MSAAADFEQIDRDGRRTLAFSGDLALSRIGDLPKRLEGISGFDTIDLSKVGRLDTVGAWLVHRAAADNDAKVEGASEEATHLIDRVAAADKPVKMRPDRRGAFVLALDRMGAATIRTGQTMIGLLGFLGAIVMATGALIRNPRRFRGHATIQQFEVVGVDALAIVGLMSFLIGIVIAQQGAVQLRQFGAEVYTINLIGRLTIRELGVLMTAIMVAGRSGSAFAAQIGTMKLTEEVAALRTIGVSPVEALVLPRMIATTFLMPLLGFYAMIVAIFGGGLFCWVGLGIPPITFLQRINEVVPMTDLWVGLTKAPVFGAIIALSGCFQGMQVEGNSEQVGLRTTAAVVQAIFMVIVLDAFFAVFFTAIGWA